MLTKSDGSKYKILVVDDERAIRVMLLDYLEEDFDTAEAECADRALALLEKEHFDLVISDINMPGTSGPKLLYEIKKRYPDIRTALITAYNIDDYIKVAMEYSITNIIPKTVPFNFAELDFIVRGLLTGDIFGISKYLIDGGKILEDFVIKSTNDSNRIQEYIINLFKKKFGTAGDMKIILDEIITNAIYHAPVNPDGSEKYLEFSDVILEENEYVYVTCGYDTEKYGVSITDYQGRLKKETILYKLSRQITGEGLLDESGRGLHMSRLFADRMIINIHPQKRTEIILLNYFSNKYLGYKPLYINEL
ncbi:MAG: response regulator [Chitinispirillaceae bacterium]|nr:response regulator [Chitinispirillaceae bacterium]